MNRPASAGMAALAFLVVACGDDERVAALEARILAQETRIAAMEAETRRGLERIGAALERAADQLEAVAALEAGGGARIVDADLRGGANVVEEPPGWREPPGSEPVQTGPVRSGLASNGWLLWGGLVAMAASAWCLLRARPAGLRRVLTAVRARALGLQGAAASQDATARAAGDAEFGADAGRPDLEFLDRALPAEFFLLREDLPVGDGLPAAGVGAPEPSSFFLPGPHSGASLAALAAWLEREPRLLQRPRPVLRPDPHGVHVEAVALPGLPPGELAHLQAEMGRVLGLGR